MKKLALSVIAGVAFLMLGSILVPPLTEQAGAQRCGSSYVKCELRNPGQFWAILNPRQQTKVLRKRRERGYR
jgi:hypothetical protein